jgi:hypothetical protein
MRACIVLLVVLLAALTGCPGGGAAAHKARVEGDKVYLPTASHKVKLRRKLGKAPPVYVKFNGVYPAGWPQDLTLPPTVHLLNQAVLEAKPTPRIAAMGGNQHGIVLSGISQGPPDEVVAFFRDQLKAAGWSITTDVAGKPSTFEGLTSQGSHQLIAVAPGGQAQGRLALRISQDTDQDGWTDFYGSVGFD